MANITPTFTDKYFSPANEHCKMQLLPFKASTAIPAGYAVGVEVSGSTTTGNLTTMATTNANGKNFVGIMAETIAATDTDYATAGKLKNVWVPVDTAAEAYFLVNNGTFTAADVFKVVSFTSDASGLDVDTIGNGAVISGYTDATHGKCKFTAPLVIQS